MEVEPSKVVDFSVEVQSDDEVVEVTGISGTVAFPLVLDF